MSHQSSILLQCTRLGKEHSYPVDIIVDDSYSKTIMCFEHTSFESSAFERVPLDINTLEGELFEIDAIKCDHQTDPESIINTLKAHLKKFHIDIPQSSLDYLKNITWPTKDIRLRCTVDTANECLNFLSPTSFEPKLYKH